MALLRFPFYTNPDALQQEGVQWYTVHRVQVGAYRIAADSAAAAAPQEGSCSFSSFLFSYPLSLSYFTFFTVRTVPRHTNNFFFLSNGEWKGRRRTPFSRLFHDFFLDSLCEFFHRADRLAGLMPSNTTSVFCFFPFFRPSRMRRVRSLMSSISHAR